MKIPHFGIISYAQVWKFQQVHPLGKSAHLSWALVFWGLSTLLCARVYLGGKGISVGKYSKGFG